MPIIRLVLQGPGAARKERPFVPSSAVLSRTYFPARGVFYSLLIHGIAFTILYFFASFPIGPPPKEARPNEQIVMIDLNDPASIMCKHNQDEQNAKCSSRHHKEVDED